MTDAETPTPSAARTATGPMELAAIALAVVAALLLLGGVLFAFASAQANDAGAGDRFRLLGQAANPFIAFLSLAAGGLVVHERRAGADRQVAANAALGISTAVSLAVVLLALNGVLNDLTGEAGTLFRLSAVVSRLAAMALSGLALWLSVTALPPKR